MNRTQAPVPVNAQMLVRDEPAATVDGKPDSAAVTPAGSDALRQDLPFQCRTIEL